MPSDSATTETPRSRRGSLAWAIALGCVLGAAAACLGEIGRMVADRNTHVVVPGRVYRTAQLTPAQLDQFVRRHGVRTVVNLRGRPFADWYPAEARATQALGVSQEDVTTSASRLPSPGEVRRLIEVFDRSEHPLLIHCQQGADRTGLAAGVYLLLYTDAAFETARRQCSPRYGHLAMLEAAWMDEFFDLYERWLADRGASHTPSNFRHWATEVYVPGGARARLELLDPPAAHDADRPIVFNVRAYNSSTEPWQFRSGSRTGVHAWYVLLRPDGQVAFNGWAGFFDATVSPGGSIDLALPVPAVNVPGRYQLYVDLSERNLDFVKFGSEPLTHDWEARLPAAPGK
jgi:predicted protein tyrosine phosphatase